MASCTIPMSSDRSESLQSFATDWEFEHGRRYHAYQAGKYNFPNDEKELERMDIEHVNQKLQLGGKLHLCPLEDPKEILDIGCGTGIWAIDMGEAYPNARVTGTDLSPVQPQEVPLNVFFEVDDFEQEWTFGENRFDMIHERFLLGSVSSHEELYRNVYTALKPGGWFEIVEMEAGTFSDDGTVPENSASNQWGKHLSEAFENIGRPILLVEEYEKLLKDAGFVNIHSELRKRPTNDWPTDDTLKKIGEWSLFNFLEGLEGWTMAPFTRALNWKPHEVQLFLMQVRREMLDKNMHGWQKGQDDLSS